MANENVKNFVDNLDKGNNDQAQADIKDALADKVSASLDDKKVDVATSMYTPAETPAETETPVETPAETPEVKGDENTN